MRISFTKQKIYLPERDEIVQKEKKLRFWAADRTVDWNDFWKSISLNSAKLDQRNI